MARAAIYLNPEAYNTGGNALMGRHSAGESFLRGYIRHGQAEEFAFWNVANQPLNQIAPFVAKIQPTEKSIRWLPRSDRNGLGDIGVAYIPTPNLARQAWWRGPFGGSAFALCGITHTTAGHDVMDMIGNLQLAPVEPWDALICTSRAVRAATETQLAATREYMTQRLGVTTHNTPILETIPLGISTDEYAFSEESRKTLRAELDIPQDAIVALYVGRFNFQAKMNPAPMAIAMEQAAKTLGRPLYWIMSGWAPDEKYAAEFHEQTRKACPSVHYRIIDGRRPEVRFSIWSAADFFLSLSDNIQETFGLTPLEAMAAGLPCVISDWDGYREGVRHNVDGFRIATYAPPPGAGHDLAYRYSQGWDNYNTYVAASSQLVAADIAKTAAAIVDLAGNPDLRRRMGQSAQAQARATLDWKVLIPRYEALWAEQDSRRLAAIGQGLSRAAIQDPWRMDPFRLFAEYPTMAVTGSTVVSLTAGMTWEEAKARLTSRLASYVGHVLPNIEEAERIYAAVAAKSPVASAELVAAFPPGRRVFMHRALIWFAKYGVVQIEASPPIVD